MADEKVERGARRDRSVGWPLWFKLALLSAIVLSAVVGNILYDRFARRTIIVEADTGTLRVTLERELSGKSFQNALVCRQRKNPDLTLRGSPFGCISRTHVLTPGETERKYEAGDGAPAPGRETFDLALPAGTRILLFSDPDRISLVVEEIPDDYAGTDVTRLEGGGITLTGAAARSFGSLVVAGRAVIGASPSETDRISVVAGNYQIRGGTWPTSWLTQERQILRSGELRSGAYFYIRDRGECVADDAGCFWNRWRPFATRVDNVEKFGSTPFGAPAAETRLNLSVPDPDSHLFRVTAISESRPVLLTALYYLSEPVSIRPTIVNALLADPILVFFATLLAGGVAVLQFFAPRSGRG